jgi:hypothetical protein
LIIFISVLREQNILEETLEYFARIPYRGKKQIVVITSEREIYEKGSMSGTTPELASILVPKMNNKYPGVFTWIHSPFFNGTSNKSTQINYALKQLSDELVNYSDTTYIGLYDADSRPDLRTLEDISRIIQQGVWPIAIQQPSLFIKNFEELNLYMKVESLFETRWALGHEVRTMRNSVKQHSDFLAPYAYCIGHGMFIRLDYLLQSGGYPKPMEDVPMGIRLDLSAIPIYPLPSYDISEVVTSFSQLIKQSGRWFLCTINNFKEIINCRHLFQEKPIRYITISYKWFIDIFTWMHYSLHLLTLIILVLVTENLAIIPISIIAFYLDAAVGIFVTQKILFKDDMSKKYVNSKLENPLIFLISPIRGFVRSLAPIMGLVELIRMNLFGSSTKTEREVGDFNARR